MYIMPALFAGMTVYSPHCSIPRDDIGYGNACKTAGVCILLAVALFLCSMHIVDHQIPDTYAGNIVSNPSMVWPDMPSGTARIADDWNMHAFAVGDAHTKDELKSYMLDLINAERARAGLGTVVFGSNSAAQSHADTMLQNCFASHWGTDGLKPYMRYSQAGGYNANAENISGLSYCIKTQDGYRSISPENSIIKSMSGLMNSPGHRDAILDPHNHAVNIGLAWDSYNIIVVQHFEYGYVHFTHPPEMTDGILSMSGKAVNGVGFVSDRDFRVHIYHDQVPHELTRGQLSRTYCYDTGLLVTALRPPLKPGWSYQTDTFTHTSHKQCKDPYAIPPDAPAPASPDDAHRIHREAASTTISSTVATLPWTDTNIMSVSGAHFEVKADISEIIQEYGPGVYTISVWGAVDNEAVNIAQVALFHDSIRRSTVNNQPELLSADTHDPPHTAGPREVIVDIPGGVSAIWCHETNECFIPHETAINVGDTVMWFNSDPFDIAYTVTSGAKPDGTDGLFDSGLILPGQSFSVTFDKAGTYQYFNSRNPLQYGIIVVQEAAPQSVEVELGHVVSVPSGWTVSDEYVIPAYGRHVTDMVPEEFTDIKDPHLYTSISKMPLHGLSIYDHLTYLRSVQNDTRLPDGYLMQEVYLQSDNYWYIGELGSWRHHAIGIRYNDTMVETLTVGTADMFDKYQDDLLMLFYEVTDISMKPLQSPNTIDRIESVDALISGNLVFELGLIDVFEDKYAAANRLVQDVCPAGSRGNIMVPAMENDGGSILAEIWCGDTNLQWTLVNAGYAELAPEFCEHARIIGASIVCR